MVAGIFEKSRRLRKAFFLGIHFSKHSRSDGWPASPSTALHGAVPQETSSCTVERLRTMHLRRPCSWVIKPQPQATETLIFTSHKQERLPTSSLQRAQTRTSAAGTGFPAGAICALRYLNCVLPASIENRFVVASRLLPDAEPRLD